MNILHVGVVFEAFSFVNNCIWINTAELARFEPLFTSEIPFGRFCVRRSPWKASWIPYLHHHRRFPTWRALFLPTALALSGRIFVLFLFVLIKILICRIGTMQRS